VLKQQLRDCEAILDVNVGRDHGLAFLQRVSRRRVSMRAEGGMSDHSGVPVHAGTEQHGVAVGKQFEHLDEVYAHTLGNQFGSLLQQGIEVMGS